MNLHLGNWVGPLLPTPGIQFQVYAYDKIAQAVPVVLVIAVATLLSGQELGSLYLRRGNLRQGLTFGFIAYMAFAVVFVVIAAGQAGAAATSGLTASGIRLDVLTASIPWILVFCFANALMEELWYRGLCLGRLATLTGPAGAVLVTALVFGSSHLGATYISPTEMVIFPTIVFLLGLVNAAVMVKTHSIWGSVLFHAGYDLMVVIPILAQ